MVAKLVFETLFQVSLSLCPKFILSLFHLQKQSKLKRINSVLLLTFVVLMMDIFTPKYESSREVLSSLLLILSPFKVMTILIVTISTIKILQNYPSIFRSKFEIVKPQNIVNYDPIILIANGFFFGVFGAGVLLFLPLINYGADCFDCETSSFKHAINNPVNQSNDLIAEVKFFVIRFYVQIFFVLKLVNFWRPLMIALINKPMTGYDGHGNKRIKQKKVSNGSLMDMSIQVFITSIGLINHPSAVFVTYFVVDGFISCLSYGYYLLKMQNEMDMKYVDNNNDDEDQVLVRTKLVNNQSWYKSMVRKAKLCSYFVCAFHGLYFMSDPNCGNMATILIHSSYFLTCALYTCFCFKHV